MVKPAKVLTLTDIKEIKHFSFELLIYINIYVKPLLMRISKVFSGKAIFADQNLWRGIN